jgi:hypothetical protein
MPSVQQAAQPQTLMRSVRTLRQHRLVVTAGCVRGRFWPVAATPRQGARCEWRLRPAIVRGWGVERWDEPPRRLGIERPSVAATLPDCKVRITIGISVAARYVPTKLSGERVRRRRDQQRALVVQSQLGLA